MKYFNIIVLVLTVFTVGCFESSNSAKNTGASKKDVSNSESGPASETEKLKIDIAAEEATYQNYLNEVEKLLKEKRELNTELKNYRSRLQVSDKVTDVPENEKVVSSITYVNSKLKKVEESLLDVRLKAKVVKAKETIATYKYKMSTLSTKSRNHGSTISLYKSKIKKAEEDLKAYTNEANIINEITQRRKQDVVDNAETGQSNPENLKKLDELEKQSAKIKKARENKIDGESTAVTRKIDEIKKGVQEILSKVKLPKISMPKFKMPKMSLRKENTKLVGLSVLPDLTLDDKNGLELVLNEISAITDKIVTNNDLINEAEGRQKKPPELLEVIGRKLHGLHAGLNKVKKENLAGSEQSIKELEAEINKLNSEATAIGAIYVFNEGYIEAIQNINDGHHDDQERLYQIRDFFENQEKVDAFIAKIKKEVLGKDKVSAEQRETAVSDIAKLQKSMALYKKAVRLNAPIELLKLQIARIENLRSPDSVKAKKNKKK